MIPYLTIFRVPFSSSRVPLEYYSLQTIQFKLLSKLVSNMETNRVKTYMQLLTLALFELIV